MGIARRKSGSVVKCPKCAGEIIVPTPEGEGELGPEGVELAGNDAEPQMEAPIDAGVTAVDTETSAPMPVLPPPPPERLGVFLSIGSLAISVVVIILLLILMFVLGLIIGKQTTSLGATPQASGHGFLNGCPLYVAGQSGATNPAFQRSHSACIARTRSGSFAARSFC